MLIWTAERPERDSLVLPDGVQCVLIPRQPASDPDLGRVEVLVPPYKSRRVLDALPRMSSLRLVQALESGVEWLLPHVPAGVPLCNSRGAHDAAVAEWVVGVILATQRHLPNHLEAQSRAQWRDIVAHGQWQPPYAGDLEGATVLIIGHGSIGTAVEQRLEPFEVNFLRVARNARADVHPAVALPGLIPDADIVVLLVPLTPTTERMIDAELLSAMKPGALLVNAGRGGLIDQDALTDALYEGRIRAALDVIDPEPLPPENRLWRALNLLLTPHIAGDTPRRYRRSWEFVGEQVERLLMGEPLLNVVHRGAKLATHHHLGTQIARVQSGVLTYTVRRGSAVVRRGESDQDPVLVRKIQAGQTAQLKTGEWIVEQPSDVHEAANNGADSVVLYLATLLKTGAPPSTPVSLTP